MKIFTKNTPLISLLQQIKAIIKYIVSCHELVIKCTPNESLLTQYRKPPSLIVLDLLGT